MKIKRVIYSSAKAEDLVALSTSINNFVTKTYPQAKEIELYDIRKNLGVIVKRFHQASSIYSLALMRWATFETREIEEILKDLENIEQLKNILSNFENVLIEFEKEVDEIKSSPEEIYTLRDAKNTKNMVLSMKNMIHYIQNMNFTPQQIDLLKRMSEAGFKKRPLPSNQKKVQKLLGSSMYSDQHESSNRTKKAIREILQNSADAILKTGKRGTIEIITAAHSYSTYGVSSMDLIVKDSGIGMDWKVLSEKFFVLGESGKEEDTKATGGYGVAKGIIQDTPEEGWSIDTNAIHSGRFHRDVYFGEPEIYTAPTSKIQPLPTGGTILTLYNVPNVYNFSVEEIASCYVTESSNLDIFVNGKKIEPKFRIEEMKKLNSFNDLTTVVEGSLQQNIVEELIDKKIKSDERNLGNIVFPLVNPTTEIRFYLKTHHDEKDFIGGRCYVYMNGQFQYHDDDYMKVDLIVLITTTLRPGMPEYPIDLSREKLTSPCKEAVYRVKSFITGILYDLSRNEMFREGLDMFVVNEGAPEMEMKPEEIVPDVIEESQEGERAEGTEEEIEKRERISKKQKAQNLAKVLETAFSTVPGTIPPESKTSTTPATTPATTPSVSQPPQTQTGLTNEDIEKQKRAEQIKAAIEAETGSLNKQQSVLLKSSIDTILEEFNPNARYNWIDRAKQIVEDLSTPCVVSVQKKFIAQEIAMDKFELVADLAIMWQRVLKIISETVAESSYGRPSIGRKFIPGIIYSNECLALYMPAKGEKKRDMIMINPITVSAITHPDLFAKLSDISAETVLEGSDDTPIERVSRFLRHEAIHEITHFLFPGSDYENFHRNITKIENFCDHKHLDIRAVVKERMPGLKRNMRKLITMIKKEREKTMPKTSKNVWNIIAKNNRVPRVIRV